MNECCIPDNKIIEYKECFDWLDKDGNGFIQGDELLVAVRAVGQYWTIAEIRQLAADYPQDRSISFEEFLVICSRTYMKKPNPKFIEQAFEVFDRNKTNSVILEDLKHVLTSIGEKLTPKEFDDILAINNIQYCGSNQTISKKEFMTIFGTT